MGISISLLTACQNSSSNSATTKAEKTTQTTITPKTVMDYKEVVENVTNSNRQKNQLPTIKMLIQLLIP